MGQPLSLAMIISDVTNCPEKFIIVGDANYTSSR
jgi:hypothetical protein